jgi:hypothetical protein
MAHNLILKALTKVIWAVQVEARTFLSNPLEKLPAEFLPLHEKMR